MTSPQVQDLLESLRTKAAQPAVQTSHHSKIPVNYPNLDHVKYVLVKKGKPLTLGHYYDGPFKIVERLGDSCIRIRVGSTAKGEPKYEVQHWTNCRPAITTGDTEEASRPLPGRKLNPQARPFLPQTTGPPTKKPFGTSGNSSPNPLRPKRVTRIPDRYNA